jgi:hypothetical protein
LGPPSDGEFEQPTATASAASLAQLRIDESYHADDDGRDLDLDLDHDFDLDDDLSGA